MYHNMDGLKFLKQLPDKSVDGIFTDPPWGKGPDILGQANYLDLMKALDDEAPRILKPRARVLIWIGIRMVDKFIKAFSNLEYRWMIFCHYIPARYIIRFQSSLDPILYFSLPNEKYPYPLKSLPQIYQKVSQGHTDTLHVCARPAKIVQAILKDWFERGEYIIDPFAGSDTTGRACQVLGNPYDGCEIDPKMYIHGIKRSSQQLLYEH